MCNEKVIGLIKVLRVPDIQAPVEIRWALVGENFPCLPNAGYLHGEALGALSGKKVNIRMDGVLVPQEQAFAILAQSNKTEAVKWWANHGFPQPGQFLFFRNDEVGIIYDVHTTPTKVFDVIHASWREVE